MIRSRLSTLAVAVLAACAVVGLALGPALEPVLRAQARTVANYFSTCSGSGCDNALVIGGTQTVASGGVLDLATGGVFKDAGVDVTTDLRAVLGAGLNATELGLLDTATAGSITASKVVSRTAALGIPFGSATPAAAGTDQTNGVALTADVNAVTGADGTKGAVLPVPAAGTMIIVINTSTTSGLKVYPGGAAVQINSLTASTGAFTVGPDREALFIGRSATQWYTAGERAATLTTAQLDLAVQGVAAGYKTARGETALDGSNPTTVATGLATIVACTVSLKTAVAPGLGTSTVTYDWTAANLDLHGWKPTGAGDTTLVASTGTETVGWICIGT